MEDGLQLGMMPPNRPNHHLPKTAAGMDRYQVTCSIRSSRPSSLLVCQPGIVCHLLPACGLDLVQNVITIVEPLRSQLRRKTRFPRSCAESTVSLEFGYCSRGKWSRGTAALVFVTVDRE